MFSTREAGGGTSDKEEATVASLVVAAALGRLDGALYREGSEVRALAVVSRGLPVVRRQPPCAPAGVPSWRVSLACKFGNTGGGMWSFAVIAYSRRATVQIRPAVCMACGSSGLSSAITLAAASSSTVPLKKSGFIPQCSLIGLTKTKSRKSSAVIQPCSTAS
jgi:hypothetical protein